MLFANLAGSLLSYVIPFVFVLSVVVFFHELGHFLVGRWCGVKVDAFSLGFGPEIFGFYDKHGTRWRIGLLPLGGYVKFHGDANGASMEDKESATPMLPSERAVTFFGQVVWKRAVIVAAGPVANFLLAIVIFTSIFTLQGRAVLVPRVDSVRPGEAADQAGFKAGDLVVSIDGHPISNWTQMQRAVQGSAGLTMAFVVERNGNLVSLTATPQVREVDAGFGKSKVALLGLNGSRDPKDFRVEKVGPLAAVQMALEETWVGVAQTAKFVSGLVAGRESADQMSGPVGIARVSGEVAKMGIMPLLNLVAILSISIGLINLVPVPLLDGGHLLYYFAEWVRGRPLSPKTQEYGFRIGLAFVLVMMLFATFNDIMHFTRT